MELNESSNESFPTPKKTLVDKMIKEEVKKPDHYDEAYNVEQATESYNYF